MEVGGVAEMPVLRKGLATDMAFLLPADEAIRFMSDFVFRFP